VGEGEKERGEATERRPARGREKKRTKMKKKHKRAIQTVF